ncbi:SGNH/GDSL hydrolase family protein [Spirosoma luteum]|uniref:SGNH/GDSL hydrolase family protein n=1 Tax=Spirosoma luteum TaxID=431553 RepID=UPI00035CFD65|nr:SGNH/GDSL hydrolase family protein [Spirosoma luteum]
MYSINWSRWGLVLALLVGVNACKNNDIDPNASSNVIPPTRGSADFTKYVAVGNSLTAGYADGGLYRDGQLNSYPSILAEQFATVGGGSFTQPLFTEAQAAGSGYLKLIRVPSLADPTSIITSIGQVASGAVRGTSTNGGVLYTKFTDANQNLGVPGIRTADILTVGYGSAAGNPFFERLVADPTATYFQYVSNNLTNATFFSCWLGNNDALGFATSGGITPLTPIALFTTNFTAIMNKLTEGGRKGVVVGIPSIITAPYFSTLAIPLVLAQVNLLLKPAAPITALYIQTTTGVRTTQAGDLLMIPNATNYASIGNTAVGTKNGPYGLSPTNPLPNNVVLDAGEVTALNASIAAFNGIMKAQADSKGVAYVDPNTVLTQVGGAAGLTQNGITYTSSFIQGGVFSLDGIHLTPAGYALMANELIKGINAKYGSTIAQVNPASYRRVLLQQ